jgi:hypothetical protein
MKQPFSTLALALGLACVAPAPAQQAPEKPPTTDQFLDRRQKDGTGVGFTNSTYEEIAEALRDLFPGLNVVVEDSLRTQKSPEIQMRNVTLRGILKALEAASSKIKVEVTADNMVTIRTLAGNQAENSKPILRTFNLNGYFLPKMITAKDESARNRAVEKALEELYQVVDQSWKMLQKADPSLRNTAAPLLQMHTGTLILISVGTHDQLRVIEEIVSNLQGMERLGIDPDTGAQTIIRPGRRIEPDPAPSR